MKPITDSIIRQIHLNLTEFGYTVTLEFVTATVEALVAGNNPSNIIGMFAANMLRKNGYLD